MNITIIPEELEKAMNNAQARLRCAVVPIVNGEKFPAVPWKKYREQFATKEEIKEWSKDHTAYGIVCSSPANERDLVGIDIDGFNGEEGCTFENIPAIFKDDYIVSTGKGFHIYKWCPVGVKITNRTKLTLQGAKDSWIVDIRGNANAGGESGGGQVLGPGSLHPSGVRKYELVQDRPIKELDMEFFNKHLLKTESKSEKKFAINKSILDGATKGERNDTATKIIGLLLARLPESVWHDVGFYIVERWNRRNTPPLPDDELWSTFISIAGREHAKRKQKFHGGK